MGSGSGFRATTYFPLPTTQMTLFPSSFDHVALAERLRALAANDVWIGTSSWKYQGWLGSIYTESGYLTRNKLSKAKFEENCLTEYAQTFPAVCGDLTFYQFPTEQYWTENWWRCCLL